MHNVVIHFSCKELPVIGDFSFQLLSSVIADSPVFSLSFNVTIRPPTNVTCYIDGNQFIISDNDLSCIVIRSEDPITVPVMKKFKKCKKVGTKKK